MSINRIWKNADQDYLPALPRGQPGGESADDDRIVTCEHDVDEQDLDEGGERAGTNQVGIHDPA